MCRLSGNSLITEPQPNSYTKIGRSKFLLIVELCHKALLNTDIPKKKQRERERGIAMVTILTPSTKTPW